MTFDDICRHFGLKTGNRAVALTHNTASLFCTRWPTISALETIPASDRNRWVLPAVAIAVVTVAALWVDWRTPLQGLTPSGEVGTVIAFRWQSPVLSPSYRVTVRRGSEIVWVANSETTERAVPTTQLFERGVTYTWQVEAIDQEGEAGRASLPRSFVLAK